MDPLEGVAGNGVTLTPAPVVRAADDDLSPYGVSGAHVTSARPFISPGIPLSPCTHQLESARIRLHTEEARGLDLSGHSDGSFDAEAFRDLPKRGKECVPKKNGGSDTLEHQLAQAHQFLERDSLMRLPTRRQQVCVWVVPCGRLRLCPDQDSAKATWPRFSRQCLMENHHARTRTQLVKDPLRSEQEEVA